MLLGGSPPLFPLDLYISRDTVVPPPDNKLSLPSGEANRSEVSVKPVISKWQGDGVLISRKSNHNGRFDIIDLMEVTIVRSPSGLRHHLKSLVAGTVWSLQKYNTLEVTPTRQHS